MEFKEFTWERLAAVYDTNETGFWCEKVEHFKRAFSFEVTSQKLVRKLSKSYMAF